jgi:hypothetical protein
MSTGILAFGSLIDDPGPEIGPIVKDRVAVTTPFPIEFARFSKKRGGAATLVPFDRGSRSAAVVLVLSGTCTVELATDMLWRREVGKAGTDEPYPAKTTKNAVRIQRCEGLGGVDGVLYVDFFPEGKIIPVVEELARKAIASVALAEEGRDGISYLRTALENGVVTPLSAAYERAVLRLTGALNLTDALVTARKTSSDGRATPKQTLA